MFYASRSEYFTLLDKKVRPHRLMLCCTHSEVEFTLDAQERFVRQMNFSELECENCGTRYFVPFNEMDCQTTSSYERGMGPEIMYFGQAEVSCPNCSSPARIEYDASEYPVGCANYSETNAKGARVVSEFGDLQLHFDEDIYHLDDSGLFLPQQRGIITSLELGAADLVNIITANPAAIYTISPREFEDLMRHVFSKHGFEVEMTKQTRDGGVDLVALQSTMGIKTKVLVECKRYAASYPVGVGLVRALYGTHVQQGANKSVLVTTSRFTGPARRFANATNTTMMHIDLKDINDIMSWVNACQCI